MELFGMDWTPPLAATRRYALELSRIISGDFGQRIVTGTGQVTPVLFGAVNPAMAALAAELAAGVVTWAAGPRTVTEVIRPALRDRDAARPFRIVAAIPVCVTDDAAAARARVHRRLGANDVLPSYQKVLRREGADGVAQLAVVGSPDEVTSGLDDFERAGVTDFAAHIVAGSDRDRDRAWEFLAARPVTPD